MSKTDWLPAPRVEMLVMAKQWSTVIGTRGERDWRMSAEEVAKFQEVVTTAENENAVQADKRTSATNIRLKNAFVNLAQTMRDTKRQFFNSPMLSDADFNSLGLKTKDKTPTTVEAPTGHAEIKISRGGFMQLRLDVKPLDETEGKSYYGCRIYYGIVPLRETENEKSPTGIHFLKKVPTSGDDLYDSSFTRKKKELLDFHADDKGNTIYFCARYENSKGQKGPWGPISSEMIG